MKTVNVVAFGGLLGNVYSQGLNTILAGVKPLKGVDFFEYEQYSEWRDVAAMVAKWKDPTIFLGHSFGVTATMATVRALGNKGPEIPLAIMFDPSQWWWSNWYLMTSGGNTVPDRIKGVVNYYQNGGIIGRQKLVRANGSEGGISNVLVENVAHGNMEDVPSFQSATVARIKQYINS